VIGKSHALGTLLPSIGSPVRWWSPELVWDFWRTEQSLCSLLCAYGTVWSRHPDVLSDKGERCLCCFLYWRSSHNTTALVIEVFVISVIYVEGAVRGNFPLCSTSHFSFTMAFIQLPNYCWEGAFHTVTKLLLGRCLSYSYQTTARKVPFIQLPNYC